MAVLMPHSPVIGGATIQGSRGDIDGGEVGGIGATVKSRAGVVTWGGGRLPLRSSMDILGIWVREGGGFEGRGQANTRGSIGWRGVAGLVGRVAHNVRAVCPTCLRAKDGMSYEEFIHWAWRVNYVNSDS